MRPGVIPWKPAIFEELADVAAVAAERLEADAVTLAPRVDAEHVDAPRLLAGGAAEAERRERDGHFDRVALRGDPACRLPDRVPRLVLPPADVVLEEVHLHSERVDEELEAPPLVVERVQDDSDEIVLEGLVAVREVGSDLSGPGVVSAESDIEVIVVVDDEAFRSHGGLDVVAGECLD